jgi:hypothetical protein
MDRIEVRLSTSIQDTSTRTTFASLIHLISLRETLYYWKQGGNLDSFSYLFDSLNIRLFFGLDTSIGTAGALSQFSQEQKYQD